MPVRPETRAVAGAIPCFFRHVETHDTAHVRADRRAFYRRCRSRRDRPQAFSAVSDDRSFTVPDIVDRRNVAPRNPINIWDCRSDDLRYRLGDRLRSFPRRIKDFDHGLTLSRIRSDTSIRRSCRASYHARIAGNQEYIRLAVRVPADKGESVMISKTWPDHL